MNVGHCAFAGLQGEIKTKVALHVRLVEIRRVTEFICLLITFFLKKQSANQLFSV